MATVKIKQLTSGDVLFFLDVKLVSVKTIEVGDHNSTKKIDLVHIDRFGQDAGTVYTNAKIVEVTYD